MPRSSGDRADAFSALVSGLIANKIDIIRRPCTFTRREGGDRLLGPDLTYGDGLIVAKKTKGLQDLNDLRRNRGAQLEPPMSAAQQSGLSRGQGLPHHSISADVNAGRISRLR